MLSKVYISSLFPRGVINLSKVYVNRLSYSTAPLNRYLVMVLRLSVCGFGLASTLSKVYINAAHLVPPHR